MTEEIRNAYQTLELPNGANLPQVQKAWREMVTVWHPDRFPNNPNLQHKAEERTKQINNAYDILKRYLKDGDIPRQPRSRTSKQSRKQESQKQTRQPRSRTSKQSQQTRKRTTNRRRRHAQSSQTDERENRQKQTTKPKKEKSLAAKIGGIIRIIFAIYFGVCVGYISVCVPFMLFYFLIWFIEAVSGWSLLDRRSVESFFSYVYFPVAFFATLVSLIVTFFGRIIDTIRAKRQNRPFIDIHEEWYEYTKIGVRGGAIGGIVCGLPVSMIGNEAITSIAAVIGAAVCARLACWSYLEDDGEKEKENDD